MGTWGLEMIIDLFRENLVLPEPYRELSEEDMEFLREYGKMMNVATYGEEIGNKLNNGEDPFGD